VVDSDSVDTTEDRAALEARIREAATAGDLQRAATEALQLYGSELFGYLCNVARDEDLASDAFGATCERMWKGLAAFRWESSLRSWLYTIARNAMSTLRAHPSRRPERNASVSELDDLAHKIRTQTLPIHRTEVREGIRALREELSPEDSELVLLRIDRKMSWRDIARVVHEGADPDKHTAALRKRFERAKEHLRRLATQRGLVG
jgi:RNA polymerase sigma-70 factor (ECF subfamily)